MKHLIIIAAVLIVSNAAPFTAAAGCGDPAIKPDTTRIVGGKEAKPHSWPWQAALFTRSVVWYQFCGGTLIAPQWILTAGHCFYKQTDTKKFKVLLGAHNKKQVESTQIEAFISEIHVNPDFVYGNGSGDICLLKLAQPVTYTDAISPICLPEKGEKLPDGTLGYVTGWGNTQSGGTSSNVLLQVGLPIVNQEKCEKEYLGSAPMHIDHTNICGGYDEGGKGSCQGDSGGPWVFQSANGTWTQEGVVSWGEGCAAPNYPSVFDRVSEMRDFIDKTMGGSL
jgi:secreted trypsin-like serine protease